MSPLKITASCLAIAIGTFATTTFAAGENATVVDAACRTSKSDTYDLGWRFGPGSQSFAGKCVNNNSVRPVVILKEDKDITVFANFYHAKKFWIAEWDHTDQPLVEYIGLHFDSGVPLVTAGHTQTNFVFAKGLRLTSQTDKETAVVKSVSISWVATFPDNVGYDLFTGIKANFALTGRAISLATSVNENILPDGSLRQFDVYPLKLTRPQGADNFARSLIASDAAKMDYFYRTLDPNCTSQLFYILDETMRATMPTNQIPSFPVFQTTLSTDPIIGAAVQAILQRHLIAPDAVPLHIHLQSLQGGGKYTVGK